MSQARSVNIPKFIVPSLLKAKRKLRHLVLVLKKEGINEPELLKILSLITENKEILMNHMEILLIIPRCFQLKNL